MADLVATLKAVWDGRQVTQAAGRDIDAFSGSVQAAALQQQMAADKSTKLATKTRELSAAVAKGEKSFDAAEKELKSYSKELGVTESATEKSGASFASMAGQAAIAGGALVAVGVAAKAAYDYIGEGAELVAAEQKFGNLAVSIDTTSDALLGKMQTATKGMLTDAELIASGTDIMSLGLAKTEGGVVRMASAVGALNLDMQVLALTMANDSTARLDNLGLSLEAVTKRKKELIASGFIGDAFDEAVLIELEAKMELLGDASQTTAGKMQILEANIANVSDNAKILVAESGAVETFFTRWADLSSGLTNVLNARKKAEVDLERAVALGIKTQEGADTILQQAIRGDEVYLEILSEVRTELENIDAATAGYNWTVEQYTMAQDGAASATYNATLAQLAGIEASGNYADALYDTAAAEDATALAAANASIVIAGRVTDFETMTGAASNMATVIAGAWSAEAVAAEDSAERQAAATLAITESYEEAALAVVEAGLQESLAEGGADAEIAALGYIAMQEALGTITSEEAEQLQQVAVETLAIKDASAEMTAAFLEDGQLTKTEAFQIAEKIREISGAVADIPKEYTVSFISDTTRWNPPNAGWQGASGGYQAPDEDAYGLATGGSTLGGGSFLVGETGPELVTLPSNSYVTNAQDMSNLTQNFNGVDPSRVMARMQIQGRRV